MAGLDPGQVLDAVHACNGPGWRLLRLATAQEVLAAEPVARAPVPTDVALFAPGGEADFEVRAFFTDPSGRLVEDPVTGSLNAALAQYVFAEGLVAGESYVAAQGCKAGANGRVYVDRSADGIWIGGEVRSVARGAEIQ